MGNVTKLKQDDESNLVAQIKTNRKEQQSIRSEQRALVEHRLKFQDKINSTTESAIKALDNYTSNPSPDNKETLTLSRQMELEAKDNVTLFDESKQHHEDDMDKLRGREKVLMEQLVNIRRSMGQNSLAAELEKLKKDLTKKLPRLLALVSELDHVPPGLLGIEKALTHQIPNLKPEFDHQYQLIISALREV